MSTTLDLHAAAMDEFDRRVRAVDGGALERGTPCADWTVADLLAHLVEEQLWVPYLLDGGRTSAAGDRFSGDVLGGAPKAAWDEAASAARAAWVRPGMLERTVDLSFGSAPATLYLWQMTFDLAVHAWDLARGIGADERLDPDLVAALLASEEFSGELVPGQNEGQGGIFAPQVPVPDSADPQTVLLARTGRAA
ncbi:TIGR03086 family metal-binding protein [Nocardiopsis coralliicola]